MTDWTSPIVVIVMGIPTAAAAIVAAFVSWDTHQRQVAAEDREIKAAEETRKDRTARDQQIADVHKLVNSTAEELKQKIAQAAFREGEAAGVATERGAPMVPAPATLANAEPTPVVIVQPESNPVPVKPVSEEKS